MIVIIIAAGTTVSNFMDCAGKMELKVSYGSYDTTKYWEATKKTTITRDMGSDLNKWVHVVITVSGTTAKIFKNGKLVVTNDDGAFSDHPLTLNGTLCTKWNHRSDFNGTLAYMKIWPRFDLKESDVAALYSRRNST